ncbi:diamine acetyltransferase 1-like [Amphiura filiformis]|uniref:diamine acetyltransferase 1-like n=1 Tax=Amphiura filiformis TaxID=82378 RepID=UPI003B225CE8
MAGKYILREACIDDCRRIHNLLEEFTKYDKKPEAYQNNIETLMADGFGEQSWFKCIVAEYVENKGSREESKEIVGFVMYTFGYDGWKGRVLNVTDFYITDDHRATKLGLLILMRLGLIVKANKVVKMCGIVSEWNTGARRFYSAVGAIDYSTEVPDAERQHYFAASLDSMMAHMKEVQALYAKCEYDDASSETHIIIDDLDNAKL